MAGPRRLTRRRLAAPLAVLTALVLVAHGLALETVATLASGPPPLRQMAEPMFTRVLQPATPPAPPAAPPRAARRASPRPAAATPPAPAEAAPAEAPAEKAQAAEAEPAAPAPAAAASAAPATDTAMDLWPPDTRITYRLGGNFRGNPLYGSGTVQWLRQGEQYQAQLEIRLTPWGTRTLTSQGELTASRLVPRAYEEGGTGRRRQLRLTDTEVVLGDGRTVPRPEGVQDAASQFADLAHRIRTGQDSLAVGNAIQVWLARPGGVDLWTFDVAAQEMLKTPGLGEIEAFRLTPRPLATARGNITAEFWLAPSMQYLPVRVRVRLGDEAEVDLLVETIEQR